MSLKAFHIIFVAAATLLSFGFGLWIIRAYVAGEASELEFGLGVASLALGFVLIVYGRYVFRKLKNLENL
jgi:hypothetical protein